MIEVGRTAYCQMAWLQAGTRRRLVRPRRRKSRRVGTIPALHACVPFFTRGSPLPSATGRPSLRNAVRYAGRTRFPLNLRRIRRYSGMLPLPARCVRHRLASAKRPPKSSVVGQGQRGCESTAAPRMS
jgi:hypothetical protein